MSNEIWEKLVLLYETEQPVSGRTIRTVKGGLIVFIGVEAFLPTSLIERHPVHDLDSYIGQDLEALVIDVSPLKRNVVLSRRAFLQRRDEQAAQALFANVSPGEQRSALVREVRHSGIVVELDGFTVEIKKSQLSLPLSSHRVNSCIPVTVCDVNRQNRTIVLTTHTESHDLDERLPRGALQPELLDDPDGRLLVDGDVLVLDTTRFDESVLAGALEHTAATGRREVVVVLSGETIDFKRSFRRTILSGRYAVVDHSRCRQTPDGFVIALRKVV